MATTKPAKAKGILNIKEIAEAFISGFDSSKVITGQVLTITVGVKTTTFTVDVVAATP